VHNFEMAQLIDKRIANVSSMINALKDGRLPNLGA